MEETETFEKGENGQKVGQGACVGIIQESSDTEPRTTEPRVSIESMANTI